MKTMPTTQQYYADPDNHGNYQFVTLKSIVEGLLLEAIEEEDHFLKHVKSYLLYKYARAAVKELAFDISGEVQPMAFKLDTNLQVTLPPDYVDYARISLIDKDGFYVPLNVNDSSDISRAYLRDSDNKIVFDSEGEAVMLRDQNIGGKGFTFIQANSNPCGGNFNTDFSKFSANGEFAIFPEDGIISFSSNLANQTIVLEYISDGVQWETLKDEEIKVKKNIETVLTDLTYLKAIEKRRNVPQSEKMRALNRYNKNKHAAKVRRAKFDLAEVAKAARSARQWNKA